MIPPFDPLTGRLRVGEHLAEWDEVVERFGWNERRRRLIDGLADALVLLVEAGCRRVWLNGSFVTTKDEPGDFDACWDQTGVDLGVLDPVLLDLSAGRAAQKARSVANCSPTSPSEDRDSCSQTSFRTIARPDVKALSLST